MFFVSLFLAFVIILLLISQHNKSKYKRLITLTIFMIMAGMICWGYKDIHFAADYKISMNKGVFDALVNKDTIFILGMCLLALSIPCALFCLLSKPKKIDEIDKLLEDQDDF